MPLIKVENEIPKEKKNISFEKDVINEIEIYSKLLGRKFDIETINLIVNEGLKYFFKKDKDYMDFKKLIKDNKDSSGEKNDKESSGNAKSNSELNDDDEISLDKK